MLAIKQKRPQLDLYIASTTHHVNLKEATKFSSATAAIAYAKTKNNFAFHVVTKPEGGLLFEKLYPFSHFAQKLSNAIETANLLSLQAHE